ncbi:YARHG domain-containing protein [Lachnospiraceae bacterium XBB2008]|nr:YARHG domain-containing protein [Lachnospiraceae bacterium XBB2008]
MKCSNCGTEYEGNFCPKCGRPNNPYVVKSKKKEARITAGIVALIVCTIIGSIAYHIYNSGAEERAINKYLEANDVEGAIAYISAHYNNSQYEYYGKVSDIYESVEDYEEAARVILDYCGVCNPSMVNSYAVAKLYSYRNKVSEELKEEINNTIEQINDAKAEVAQTQAEEENSGEDAQTEPSPDENDINADAEISSSLAMPESEPQVDSSQIDETDSTDTVQETASTSVTDSTLANSENADTSKTDDYIVDGTDSGYFLKEFFEQLTDEELRLARNEIYARHGRRFNSEDLNDYFNSKSWYTPQYDPDEFDAKQDEILNTYEKANRDVIVEVESDRKQGISVAPTTSTLTASNTSSNNNTGNNTNNTGNSNNTNKNTGLVTVNNELVNSIRVLDHDFEWHSVWIKNGTPIYVFNDFDTYRYEQDSDRWIPSSDLHTSAGDGSLHLLLNGESTTSYYVPDPNFDFSIFGTDFSNSYDLEVRNYTSRGFYTAEIPKEYSYVIFYDDYRLKKGWVRTAEINMSRNVDNTSEDYEFFFKKYPRNFIYDDYLKYADELTQNGKITIVSSSGTITKVSGNTFTIAQGTYVYDPVAGTNVRTIVPDETMIVNNKSTGSFIIGQTVEVYGLFNSFKSNSPVIDGYFIDAVIPR